MSKAFAYLVVGLRFPLILGWAAAVVAATACLPPLPSSGGLADLVPAGSAAAHADADATRLFGYPLEAGVAIVQRDPHGLPPSVVQTTARAAVGYDRSPGIPGLLAVVPVAGPGRRRGRVRSGDTRAGRGARHRARRRVAGRGG